MKCKEPKHSALKQELKGNTTKVINKIVEENGIRLSSQIM